MGQIRYLIFAVLGVLALSLPLGGRPSHRRPILVLPRFRFDHPGQCSDPSLEPICNKVNLYLPELKAVVERDLDKELKGDYKWEDEDEEFYKVEQRLKENWKKNDHGDESLRPYIIEAKVVQGAEDGYYIVFHGRLVGETAWQLPQTCPLGAHCKLIELGTKHSEHARKALATVCSKLLEDWKHSNEQ